MCTAVSWSAGCHYFGRTLDYEHSFGEEVVIIPRQFPLSFRNGTKDNQHYAMIGMAHVENTDPLLYEAVNERGLAAAGLNFVGNACYGKAMKDKLNLAHFELIPWLLGKCATVSEARNCLMKCNITDDSYNESLSPAELHWMLADDKETITVEPMENGLCVYSNPVGVLTNNPPFPVQMYQLNNYMNLSPYRPEMNFPEQYGLFDYSRGMGAMGLPGDLSSQSRFIRAVFTKTYAVPADDEKETVGRFFHILDTVRQTKGCCRLENGEMEETIYSSCCNADKGIYYYSTCRNRMIRAVCMHGADLDGSELYRFPVNGTEQVDYQNELVFRKEIG